VLGLAVYGHPHTLDVRLAALRAGHLLDSVGLHVPIEGVGTVEDAIALGTGELPCLLLLRWGVRDRNRYRTPLRELAKVVD
jgi:hypothetical protein